MIDKGVQESKVASLHLLTVHGRRVFFATALLETWLVNKKSQEVQPD